MNECGSPGMTVFNIRRRGQILVTGKRRSVWGVDPLARNQNPMVDIDATRGKDLGRSTRNRRTRTPSEGKKRGPQICAISRQGTRTGAVELRREKSHV